MYWYHDMNKFPWLFVFPDTTDNVWRNLERFTTDTSEESNCSKILLWSPTCKPFRTRTMSSLSQFRENWCLLPTPPVIIFFWALSRNWMWLSCGAFFREVRRSTIIFREGQKTSNFWSIKYVVPSWSPCPNQIQWWHSSIPHWGSPWPDWGVGPHWGRCLANLLSKNLSMIGSR